LVCADSGGNRQPVNSADENNSCECAPALQLVVCDRQGFGGKEN